MPLERYLTVVAMLMRRIGWTSRTKAREYDVSDGVSSTADDASRYIFAKGQSVTDWINYHELYADDEDSVLAGCAIEWARNIDDGGSEYLHTIKKIAESGVCDFKGLDGYAASIIVAYKNALNREREKADRDKNAPSKVYYGEAKKRSRNVRVTCKGTNSWEGSYGPTTLVRFEHRIDDDKVAVLVWFASGYKERDWVVGAEYDVDFTVKGHDDHDKFGAQTKINRCKAVAGPFGGDEDSDRKDGERLAGYDG